MKEKGTLTTRTEGPGLALEEEPHPSFHKALTHPFQPLGGPRNAFCPSHIHPAHPSLHHAQRLHPPAKFPFFQPSQPHP